jgi:hypothetical protein
LARDARAFDAKNQEPRTKNTKQKKLRSSKLPTVPYYVHIL